MIPAAFAYSKPSTLEEAFEALATPGSFALAGGHSLLPEMKLRLLGPELLVDIAGLCPEGVSGDGGVLRIGALTTYSRLLSADPRLALPDALREAARSVNDAQVRNAGTIGGALAYSDPRMDILTALLALEASLVLTGPGGGRTVPVQDFLVGPFETALGKQELIVEVLVPAAAAGEVSAYVSTRDPAAGFPLAGAAARLRGGELRIAATSGRRRVWADAVEALAIDADDDYRAELTRVMARRAVEAARARQSGE